MGNKKHINQQFGCTYVFFISSEFRLIEVSDNPYALELENNSIMSLINKSGMHVLNAINNVIYKYTIACT